ncbi:MAG: S26 family signal peptidase [Nanoarchaeota archaeon]|nr:S26 family signal peptidase [Nanoarchaeota archaeon]
MGWIKNLFVESEQITADTEIERVIGKLKHLVQKKNGISDYNEYEAIKLIIDYLCEYNPNASLTCFREISLRGHSQTHGEILLAIGTSMTPEVKDGDILIIVSPPRFYKGDIVNFYSIKDGKERLSIHKLIGSDDKYFYCCGNYDGSTTEKVPSDCVAGKVSAIIKKEENPAMWNFLYDKLSFPNKDRGEDGLD